MGKPETSVPSPNANAIMSALRSGAIPSVLTGIGSIWIFAIMFLINFDVFSRFLFNRPISGVPLVVSMSIVAIVFLQLTDTLRLGRMTRNDVMIGRLLSSRPDWGHALQAVFNFAGFTLMGLVCYFTLPLFEKAWQTQSFLGNQGDFTFLEWPIKFTVILGSFVCMAQYAVLCVDDIKKSLAATGQKTRWVPLAWTLAGLILAVVVALSGILNTSNDMVVGAVSVIFVLIFVYVGLHVGVALAALSFLCIWLIRDDPVIAGKAVALAAGDSLQRYEFGVIPLFILMGYLVSVSDVGRDVYQVANQLFRKLKGGLGTATVVANAIFAAVTGTSIASASVFTKVAVPEMMRHGYHPRFSVGVVAGSSVLGMLIPPSLLLILFGILAETSIGDLFIAGVVPGIVLAAAYALLIALMAHRYPKKVFSSGTATVEIKADLSQKEIWLKVLPMIALIVMVLGGIYGGVFTATEAAGVGALGALVVALLKRKLTPQKLWQVLVEAGHVTAALSFLLIGAAVYSRMIALSGIPDATENLIQASGLGFMGLIVIYLVVIILLDTILDAGSIMLILVPLVIPILLAMEGTGVDINGMVWFGIITIIGVEIGLLTPPLGLACFVIHNNLQDPRISVNDVFFGAFPFAVTMLVVLILIVVLPDIALFLGRLNG